MTASLLLPKRIFAADLTQWAGCFNADLAIFVASTNEEA